MNIDNLLHTHKAELLHYFRHRASESLQLLTAKLGSSNGDKIASAINPELSAAKDALITSVRQTAEADNWSKETLLKTILLANYCRYVAMLEARNSVRRL